VLHLLDVGQNDTDSSRRGKVSAQQRMLQQLDIPTCDKNRGSSWLLMSHSSPHPDFDPPSWVCAYHHLHKSRLGRHSARNWVSGVALLGTTRQDKQPGRVNFPESRPTCSMGEKPDSYDVLVHVSTPQGTADGWAGGPIPQLFVWSGWQRWRLWLVQPGTGWCAQKV
jgi:hypothetical protein